MALKKTVDVQKPPQQATKKKGNNKIIGGLKAAISKRNSKPKLSKQSSPKRIPKKSSPNRLQKISQESTFIYEAPSHDEKNFLITAELIDTARIETTIPGHPIRIINPYSKYMQILEVEGKDLDSLSQPEQDEVVSDFASWLTEYQYDVIFETTKLPTNTRKQLISSLEILHEVQRQYANPDLSVRKYQQLKDREQVLKINILAQEEIANKLYNAEFLLLIHADTTAELEKRVKAAKSAGNKTYSPRIVSDNKKKQIIKQYNNQHEKV